MIFLPLYKSPIGNGRNFLISNHSVNSKNMYPTIS